MYMTGFESVINDYLVHIHVNAFIMWGIRGTYIMSMITMPQSQ